jgi:Metal-dependent hydrolases of the beta-lactamase superfamily III
MLVTVLGFYGGYPYKGIGTSGYLLRNGDKSYLIDCGSGVLNSLASYMKPTDLDGVILSHYHHDHTADVGVLQYEWLAAKKEIYYLFMVILKILSTLRNCQSIMLLKELLITIMNQLKLMI